MYAAIKSAFRLHKNVGYNWYATVELGLGKKDGETIVLCAFQSWRLSRVPPRGERVSTPGPGRVPTRTYFPCQPQRARGQNFQRATLALPGTFPLQTPVTVDNRWVYCWISWILCAKEEYIEVFLFPSLNFNSLDNLGKYLNQPGLHCGNFHCLLEGNYVDQECFIKTSYCLV